MLNACKDPANAAAVVFDLFTVLANKNNMSFSGMK